MKKYYVVGRMSQSLSLKINGRENICSLKLPDGTVGVLSVYSNKKNAKKSAGKKYSVFEFEVTK